MGFYHHYNPKVLQSSRKYLEQFQDEGNFLKKKINLIINFKLFFKENFHSAYLKPPSPRPTWVLNIKLLGKASEISLPVSGA
jgi:hypothetical protein